MSRYVLAIDEGSTGVRALLFNRSSQLVGAAYEEIAAAFPQPGWVEQDAQAIWEATRRVVALALQRAHAKPSDVAAIGVTNQRATTLVWERGSGRPVYPAISWQDSRTVERVNQLLNDGIFTNTLASLTKVEWILRQHERGFQRAGAGELCFGTMDTWLVWQLSGGRTHVTDPSNASCTNMCDYLTGRWDHALLGRLELPARLLPEIRGSSEVYGTTDPAVFGAAVPIGGIAGDQQAAMFGELGTERGAVKVTYGTSGMVDVNSGDVPVLSQRGAYPLILWEIAGQRPFCLEGTVVTAGAAVQWLRDGLGVLTAPEESGRLAASVPESNGVWAVPELQGLGTPYMRPSSRAVIGGLSRGTTRAHIVRAVLEGIAFRSREVLDTLLEDAQMVPPSTLRVDGGAAANDFLLQCLADVLGLPVERPETVQASGLGAAYLAGIAAGIWNGIDELRHAWRSGGVFSPRWSEAERQERFAWWQARAIAAAKEE
jgi:glycerol kinase